MVEWMSMGRIRDGVAAVVVSYSLSVRSRVSWLESGIELL